MKLFCFNSLTTMLCGIFVFGFSTFSFSQKLGHVNSTKILEEMPAMSQANKELEAFQTDLFKKGEKLVSDLQADYHRYLQEVNEGNLSQVEMQKREAGFKEEQNNLAAFEQEVQAMILRKRETLFKPILEKIDIAIKEYGKQNGYAIIFDSSGGQTLYAQSGIDLTSEIQKIVN